MSEQILRATTTATGGAFSARSSTQTFQATVSGSGSVSATVVIEVKQDRAASWLTLGTITLAGTTSASDGFACAAQWALYRARVTAISAGHEVTVEMNS